MDRARKQRLKSEYENLLNLQNRSERDENGRPRIEITPEIVQEGLPPEKYVITFRCKGISGIKPKTEEPIPSYFHQVELTLDLNFPVNEPLLKWLTPIWHPNIDHQEPHHVCTNNIENWNAAKTLDFLAIELGKMAQYKKYYAVMEPPYPLDRKVANWVREYAEPRNIVGPNNPFDDTELLSRMIGLGASQSNDIVIGKIKRTTQQPGAEDTIVLGRRKIIA